MLRGKLPLELWLHFSRQFLLTFCPSGAKKKILGNDFLLSLNKMASGGLGKVSILFNKSDW
jgi:hypothetical protein